jgi:hypothetical protein
MLTVVLGWGLVTEILALGQRLGLSSFTVPRPMPSTALGLMASALLVTGLQRLRFCWLYLSPGSFGIRWVVKLLRCATTIFSGLARLAVGSLLLMGFLLPVPLLGSALGSLLPALMPWLMLLDWLMEPLLRLATQLEGLLRGNHPC